MRACDYCGQPSVDACLTCLETKPPQNLAARCQDCLHLGHGDDGHAFKSYNAWAAEREREGWHLNWSVQEGYQMLSVHTPHPVSGLVHTFLVSLPCAVATRVERIMKVDPAPIYAIMKDVLRDVSTVSPEARPWEEFGRRVTAFVETRP